MRKDALDRYKQLLRLLYPFKSGPKTFARVLELSKEFVDMHPGGHMLIGLLIVLVLGFASFKYTPEKLANERVVWRSSCILTLVCCFTMWVVTYMAQINPLVQPERTWIPRTLSD